MRFLICLGALALSAIASASDLEISTKHGDERELKTKALVEAFDISHDLEKWTFTDKIFINRKSIPHSHPVLTLHTRHNGQPDMLLSTYLHEQIHWFLDAEIEKTDAAIEELKTIFKDVPVGRPNGARSEYSTYLHLLVCFLEIDAVSQLLSADRADKVLNYFKQDHYIWVYQQVDEKNAEIGAIVDKYGLRL